MTIKERIVKDKQATMLKAHSFVIGFMESFSEECSRSGIPENDPAELAYLALQTASLFVVSMCHSLDGFANVYGITGLTVENSFRAIMMSAEENMITIREAESKMSRH